MFNENNGEALKAARFLNYTLTGVVLIIAIAVVGLSQALVWQGKDKERTFVPPHIDRPFTVSNTGVDDAYLSLIGEWWVHLKFNVTPTNVNRQFDLLLGYVSPEHWNEVQEKLIREAVFVKDNDVTSFFNVDSVAPSVSTLKIRIKGTLNKTVGGRKLPPEPVTYIFQAGYPNGLIELHTIAKEVQP